MKKKNLIQILIGLCLVVVLILPLMIGCQGEESKKIGISQIVTHPALDATREGIIQGLADKGYVDGENIVIDYQNS